MNKLLEKWMFAEFEPGKREHAFYEDGITYDSSLTSNHFAMVSNEEHGYYVYVWDEEQQKHVRRWVD